MTPEQILEAIIDMAVDCIITANTSGIILSCNKSTTRLFGYQSDELIGRNLNILMPEPFHGEHDGYLHSYLESGTAKIIGIGREVIARHKNGHNFPIELSVNDINNDGVRIFVGIIRDISRRRDAENALIDSERMNQAIVNTVIDGIITIDEYGMVQSFNRAAEQIFGRSAASIIGMNVNHLMPAPYAEKHDGYLQYYKQTGDAKIIGIGREVEGLRSDGSVFPMDLAVTEMELGGKTFYTGIVRDITERKRVDKMKNEFISTVSHELRTPLTSIRGSLGLINSGAVGEISSQIKDMLKIASNNTERLLVLINDILDIQKIESGMMSFKYSSLQLFPLIKDVIADMELYADQYDVKYVFHKMIEDIHVFVDKDRLVQVLANLLSNAAKFSPPGETVEISLARHHNSRIRVSVTDHGPGIPEGFKGRIFQRFSQSDSSDTRTKGGTGLGLAISRAIMKKLNGHIDFISREGVGSTFYIELPEIPSTTKDKLSIDDLELLGRHCPCVLVVEDDPDIAALIQRMLTEAGFDSDIAYNTEQARQLLTTRNFGYKLITLDIILPGEDGVSLLSELREDENTRDIPVVVISVKADETKKSLNGSAIGVLDWMQKPFDQSRLTKVVASIAEGDIIPRVLHVEDDQDVHTVVASMLSGVCELVWTTTIAASKEILQTEKIDLVLLDIDLPDGSGLDLLDTIEKYVQPPRVVVFSAQEVADHYAERITTALVKSKTGDGELLNNILANLKKPR